MRNLHKVVALIALSGMCFGAQAPSDGDAAARKSTGVGTLIRSLTGQLSRLAENLGGSSREVAAAANQVSLSSQSLAEGSSEQAASIEETGSSLEELSSMTKRNADNSQNANELSRQSDTLRASVEGFFAAIRAT